MTPGMGASRCDLHARSRLNSSLGLSLAFCIAVIATFSRAMATESEFSAGCMSPPRQQHAPVAEMSQSPSGKYLAILTKDQSLWISRAPDFVDRQLSMGPDRYPCGVRWSPDSRWLLVEGGRIGDEGPPNYIWGTLWLVDPDGKASARDLLPPGSPFATPGARVIEDAIWLDNHLIYFSMHCGSGCVGHYAVDVNDGGYKIFCTSSGQFAWAPNREVAVSENYGSGPSPIGLGLVDSSSAGALARTARSLHAEECKSVFSGGYGGDDPASIPGFVAWLADSRHVIYRDGKDRSLHIWDTQTGDRRTVLSDSGPLSK